MTYIHHHPKTVVNPYLIHRQSQKTYNKEISFKISIVIRQLLFYYLHHCLQIVQMHELIHCQGKKSQNLQKYKAPHYVFSLVLPFLNTGMLFIQCFLNHIYHVQLSSISKKTKFNYFQSSITSSKICQCIMSLQPIKLTVAFTEPGGKHTTSEPTLLFSED